MPLSGSFLLHPAEQRLASRPLPRSLEFPAGHQIGASQPRRRLIGQHMRALMHLVQGAISRMAEHDVEGRFGMEGRWRDLMAAHRSLYPFNRAHVQAENPHVLEAWVPGGSQAASAV